MYIPGRFLTASNPSNLSIFDASYLSTLAGIVSIISNGLRRKKWHRFRPHPKRRKYYSREGENTTDFSPIFWEKHHYILCPRPSHILYVVERGPRFRVTVSQP